MGTRGTFREGKAAGA